MQHKETDEATIAYLRSLPTEIEEKPCKHNGAKRVEFGFDHEHSFFCMMCGEKIEDK